MGNLQDYLRWRGDLRFADHPFNLVDNLVLCALAYLDLNGVVPGPGSEDDVTVSAASQLLVRSPPDLFDPRRLVFVPPSVLHDLAEAPRFRHARLSGYVDVTDPDSGVQFAALSVHLDDGTTYVAYRGTDTSIVGWKEDFVMSFQLMPSHRLAAGYLADVVRRTDGEIRVGGHSKGANLAVYAAMGLADADQDRIAVIYDNDGPGLSPDVVDPADLDQIGHRIIRITPEFAVIGMLFHSTEPDKIVASAGQGIMQHDIMTWQVRGSALCERAHLAGQAITVNQAIAGWLGDVSVAERRDVTDALFGALAAGGATLVQDVAKSDFGSVESVLLSLARTRGRLRRPLGLGVRTTARAFAAVDYLELFQHLPAVRSALIAVVGVFLIAVPRLGTQVLGALAVAGLCVLVGVRLLRYLLRFRRRHQIRGLPVVVAILLLAVVIAATTQIGAFIVPMNLFLGLAFVLGAWHSARAGLAALGRRPRRVPRAVLLFVNAVVALLFGIVALSTSGRVMPFFVQQAGQYCLIVGLVGLFLIVRDQAALEYRRREAEHLLGPGI